jgi:hypothetical protein
VPRFNKLNLLPNKALCQITVLIDGRVMVKGQRVDLKGTSGNIPSLLNMDFTSKIFEGSFIGIDLINSLVGGVVDNVIDTVIDSVI